MLIQQLLAKFPADFLLKLEQSKESTVPWTMEKLHKVIVCQVNIQENVSHFVVHTNVHEKGQYEHDHVNKKGYHTHNKHEFQKSSAEVFSSVSTNTG